MARSFKINLHRHNGTVHPYRWPVFDTTGNFPYYEPAQRTDNLITINQKAMDAYPTIFHGLNFTAPLFVCADSSGTALDNVNHIMSYGFASINIDQILSDEYFELANGSTIKLVDITRTSYSYRFTCKYYNAANVQCYPDFQLETTLLTYNTGMLFLPFCADIAGGNYTLLTNQILRVNINSPYFEFATSGTIAPTSAALGKSFWEGYEPVDDADPYQDIPDSEPSGPAEGTGIPASDPIDFPSLPTFSVTDTGFITLFNPTLAQVKNLADYMWNGLFDVNNFKKIFADPMDCILGFNMVPVAVPSGSAANINIGNIVTSVTMNIATSQWVELDCGTINIGLPYGSYLDYSPYTKFSIYLPYIGTFDLSTDDVAGKSLHLKYHVDTLSCSCVAYLKCGDHVLYQWTGACGYSIPVTQNDFSRMIMTIISIAAAGVGGAITAGAAGAGMVGMLGGAAKGAGESAAKNVMGLKPDVHRSGAIGSGAGLMGGQTPYLIIEIPNACKPKKQYHYTGYPGFITTTIGDLTGYAEFESIILDGIGCTEEERGIIENLLTEGVYI